MHAPRAYRTAGLVAALALGTSGCFGGAEHEVTPTRPIIRSFTASPSSIVSGSAAVLSWTVSGAAGISIAPGVGSVTGTSVAVTPSATTTYVLSATSAGGTSTTSITVTVGPAPPAGLTYSRNPATYTLGQAITPNVPSSTGGVITSYAVNPSLPAGLSLSASTGVISGTPTTVAASTAHTVTGSNAAGTTTAIVTLTVTDPPPANLSYATNPATYTEGVTIAPNLPTASGGVVSSYAVAPLLPAGLSLDAATGVISGTPTASSTTATYTVTATNPGGNTTVGLVLTVNPPPPVLAITTPPAGRSVLPPVPATFSVVAAGLPPFTYQWRRNSVDIPGATAATYTTPATVPGDQGAVFDVVVTDALPRSITSVGAVLSLRGFYATGAMATARAGHTSTLLAGSGKVLVVGGSSGAASLASAELYDPVGGTFSATGSMAVAREGHSAVALADGRVLVVGGCTGSPSGCTTYLASAEIYDPDTGLFTDTTGSMETPRADFAAALVGTRVLVAGGFWYDPDNAQDNYLGSAELFDPATETFTAVSPMNDQRRFPMAASLPDGTVLVAGGEDPIETLATAEAYDPGADSFVPAASMTTARKWGTATLLVAGQVLVVGGLDANFLAVTDRYDPATGSFTPTGSLNVASALQTATRLVSGEVLVAGGSAAGARAELYDPVAGLFASAPSMAVARSRQTATLLLDGTVLIAGGASGAAVRSSAERWAPYPGP